MLDKAPQIIWNTFVGLAFLAVVGIIVAAKEMENRK
jgi:hypothetical protein